MNRVDGIENLALYVSEFQREEILYFSGEVRKLREISKISENILIKKGIQNIEKKISEMQKKFEKRYKNTLSLESEVEEKFIDFFNCIRKKKLKFDQYFNLLKSKLNAFKINQESLQVIENSTSEKQKLSLQNIEDLELKYFSLKEKIKCFDDRILLNLQNLQLSNEENKQLSDAWEEFDLLCNYLQKTYAQEWNLKKWHGIGSLQRMIWQDERFVEFMQEPLFVKVFLKRNTEIEGLDIKKLVLFGLAHHRFSYLITVPPNWCCAPKELKDKLYIMDVGERNYKAEREYRLNPSYMNCLFKALASIEKVLEEEYLPVPKAINNGIEECIQKASVIELIAIFNQLIINKDKIKKLTEGSAGASTEPKAMVRQCFEVMNHFDLLCKTKKPHEVLNYGIVSHALDSRHLAAALYWLLNNKELDSQYDEGKEVVLKLLRSPNLLKIRLQQILQLIVDNQGKLAISRESIVKACKEGKISYSEKIKTQILSLNFINSKKIKISKNETGENNFTLMLGKHLIDLQFNEKEMTAKWKGKQKSFAYGKEFIDDFISFKNSFLYSEETSVREKVVFAWRKWVLPKTDEEWIEQYAHRDLWSIEEKLSYVATCIGTYGFYCYGNKQIPSIQFLVRTGERSIQEYNLEKFDSKWFENVEQETYASLSDFVGSLRNLTATPLSHQKLRIEKAVIKLIKPLPSYRWGVKKIKFKKIDPAQISPKKLLYLSGYRLPISAHDFLSAAETLRKEGEKKIIIHQLYDKAAEEFIRNTELDKAFQVRAMAANHCDPQEEGALYALCKAVQKPQQQSQYFSLYFTNLGGALKGGAIKVSHRIIDESKQIQIEFKLSHPAREALQENLMWIQGNMDLFIRYLPEALQTRVHMHFSEDLFMAKYKGKFSSIQGYTPKHAQVIEIEFIKIGKVVIGNTPQYGCLYNTVKVFVPVCENTQTRVHQMLTMLGMGPILSPQRKKEDQRLKLALIFRTYFPREAVVMERTKEFYELPLEDLLLKMVTAAPGLCVILEKYKNNPQWIQKVETFEGKKAWALMDISEQMSEKGAYGLMASVGGESKKVSHSVEHASRICKKGLHSSQDRFFEGFEKIKKIKGLSSEEDLLSGGGDYVFTRLVNKHNCDQKIEESRKNGQWSCVGHFQILYDLDCVNVGAYAYHKDCFGFKNIYGNKDHYAQYEQRGSLIQMAETVTRGDNEVMIKNMIPPRHIRGIVCQKEEYKKLLLERLKKKELIQEGKILGKPIDEFVYVSDIFKKEMWSKN